MFKSNFWEYRGHHFTRKRSKTGRCVRKEALEVKQSNDNRILKRLHWEITFRD